MKQSTHPEDMRLIAKVISQMFPGLAFALVVTEVGPPGTSTGDWISNMRHDDLVPAMEEFVTKLKEGQTFVLPESN
jgi:hypothetical protein